MLSWIEPGSPQCCRWLCCFSCCASADSPVSLRGLKKRSHVLCVCTGEPAQEQQRKHMEGSWAMFCAALLTHKYVQIPGTSFRRWVVSFSLPHGMLWTKTPGAPAAQTLDKPKCSPGHPPKCKVSSDKVLQKGRVVRGPQRAPNSPKAQEYKVCLWRGEILCFMPVSGNPLQRDTAQLALAFPSLTPGY